MTTSALVVLALAGFTFWLGIIIIAFSQLGLLGVGITVVLFAVCQAFVGR